MSPWMGADDIRNSASQAKSRPPTTGTITVDHLTFKTSRNTDGILCNGLAEIDGKSLKHAQEVLRVPVYGVGYIPTHLRPVAVVLTYSDCS